ncbi:recombination-associated protein RdgC [Paludibacterium paludis]|uniref:Recombination-associated protein RdgC n=1 Tax=Paludibacterium paludis TaxID=1225769 RepID=A0A918NYJ8_9NEIS|nr:recombination-associated protein RdgC [Paludibacterium paludis]GGY05223.1 recombination-associated protein RdgC [Paludibacterium paludis]
MWFRQLTFYRLSGDTLPDAAQLADALEKKPFHPCGGLDWFTEGWVPPAKHLASPVFPAQGGCLAVLLRREDKVLPAGVIRDQLDSRVSEIEAQEMRNVGRKEKLALKEQITDDLLPRAFVRSQRLSAYLDTRRRWMMVDSGTASRAEALVSQLREALPPFPAALPRTALSPHAAMTAWLADGAAPDGFELDADCELKDSSENGAVVRCSRIDLTAEEIRQHIATGKVVTRLGLIWRERIRFMLTDTLQLKRIQFLDVLQEEASHAGDDIASLYEATFTLMSGELGELVDELVEALGGLEDSQLGTVASHAAPLAASPAPSVPADGDADVPWDD